MLRERRLLLSYRSPRAARSAPRRQGGTWLARETGTWGYLANAFVLAPYGNQGIGARLPTALLAHADDQGYLRVVLRPSERAVPFYQWAGFTAHGGFLIRYAPPS